MSYYEKRIADLEARVAEMALQQSMKAIPVEAKLLERYALMQAENTRLRKAGDDLHKSMFECGPNEMAEAYHHDEWWKSYYAWNAAKEGKV